MAVFFAVMTVCALAFWLAALVVPGGIPGVIGLIGIGAMTLFGTFHILAAVTGVLLWQWERHRLRPVTKASLEASTIYFCIAVLASIFFNYLARTCWTESSRTPRAPALLKWRRLGGGIQVRGQPSSAPPRSDDDIISVSLKPDLSGPAGRSMREPT
jgi:hypothetical protein